MDINDPRNPNHIPNTDLQRGMIDPELRRGLDGRRSYMWSIIAVVAALVAGMLFFGNIRTNEPNTQVGQNVERPVTPNTPKTTTPQ